MNLRSLPPSAINTGFILLLGLATITAASNGFQALPTQERAAGFALGAFMAHPFAFLPLIGQLLALLGLHGLLFWFIASLGRRRPEDLGRPAAILALTWLAALWLLLRLNGWLFPRSIWSWSIAPVTSQPASVIVDFAACAWLCMRSYRGLRSSGRRSGYVLAGVCMAGLLLALPSLQATQAPAAQAATPGHKPNIVIIGLDSLRRDYALAEDPSLMPHLGEFRRDAFVHANVISPLARTFPAWVTILSGEPPATHGVRDNLVPPAGAERRSLAWTLKQQGYRTIYATDESRFSNIDRRFGFDQVISPLPGVADFLLGQFSDQPLINLVLQLPAAELLLPSLVGNRAFATAYVPKRFIRRLADQAGPASGRPTLLAVHLCIAHWPYHSAGSTPGATPYDRAVQELDLQFGQLLSTLTHLGYITDQTVVAVLADHGESLASHMPHNPEIIRLGTQGTPSRPVSGHGASLLDPAQWEVFTLFRGRSAMGPIPPGRSDQLLSLAHLSQGLLQLAGVDRSDSGPVLDVVAAVRGGRSSVAHSHVLMETGFSPRGLDLANPSADAALQVAKQSFDITEDGRLAMKPQVSAAALAAKEFGVTDGRRTLVLTPAPNPLLVALEPDYGRQTVYPAQSPPISVSSAPPLLKEACREADIRQRIPTWCARWPESAPP